MSSSGRGTGAPAAEIPESGHGLAGMRERAALAGGELEAGPARGGGFRVRARLPRRHAVRRPPHDHVIAGGPARMTPVRVLIADDQELVRTGFRMILDEESSLSIVGEAGDGLEAVELAETLRPDVVLMDIRMPGIDGLEATRRILARPHERADPGPRADDVRPQRVRLRGAARGRERLPAQGRVPHAVQPSDRWSQHQCLADCSATILVTSLTLIAFARPRDRRRQAQARHLHRHQAAGLHHDDEGRLGDQELPGAVPAEDQHGRDDAGAAR